MWPVRWLVDGMNLIGVRSDGWWRDRDGAVRRLAAELGRYAELTGEELAVVFDGRPVELDAGSAAAAFASRAGPDAADDDIAARVAADPDPASLTVVTSDAKLAERVRRHGAAVVSAGTFRRMLDSG